MRTSFHHQPEAQHPKSPAIETPAGRLPHLLSESGQTRLLLKCPLSATSGHRARSIAQRGSVPAPEGPASLRSWANNRTTSLPSRALSRFSGVSFPSGVLATKR